MIDDVRDRVPHPGDPVIRPGPGRGMEEPAGEFRWSVEDIGDRRGELLRIVGPDQGSGLAAVQDVRCRPRIGSDQRHARQHRLYQSAAKGLGGDGRMDDDIDRLHQPWHVAPMPEEMDALPELEPVCQLPQTQRVALLSEQRIPDDDALQFW